MKTFLEFMKVFLLLFIVPFVLVWTAWFLTGMSFSIKDAFGEPFWFISVLYWLFTLVAAGALTEDENSKPKRRYKSGSF